MSALVGPARVVLRDLDEAKATMAALKGLRGGRIDLVTMPSPGMEPLTTILTAFSRAHPDVTVNAEAAFTPEEVLALVRTGSAEVGILGSAEPTVAADLDVVSLERQALVLISGPNDDGPTEDFISREDLTGFRLIVSQRGSLMRALVDDVLASGVEITHCRRNRPPHFDSADGPQGTRACRDARVVDRHGPSIRCPRANHHA